MTPFDERWMKHALDLAERGRGLVEPNPLVGAVLVRDGQNVGEGWHQKYGQAHAEINAIGAAGEAARGATLYVTLEPCCHHGKTPPCVDALVHAGICRVVVAMADPYPSVAGNGIAVLRRAGIEVEVGPGELEAQRLNAPYLKLLWTGRPYVHAKWAMTLDGKIATAAGNSKWITNRASRERVHELRGRMDAIVTGIGTVLADDPLLTARPPGPRVAARVVLDSRGRLPRDCQLANTARLAPVIVVTADEMPAGAVELQQMGCDILAVPSVDGRLSLTGLLDELGRRRMTNLLVEGGAEVLGSFLDAGEIDEVHVYIAPSLVGGATAKTPIAGQGVQRLAEALVLKAWRVEELEGNLLIHGWREETRGQGEEEIRSTH
jgi:diaminohydroxyphosphoribosylaminopyrimidine deaminase/5-amino-6-(5-phosphoribosylamino)uracil reductase